MNIDKLLPSEENPLISVVRIDNPMRIKRGMAFVYKKLTRKYKVVVSCRHNFLSHPFNEFKFFLGANKNQLKVISGPYFHQDEAQDIVMFLVEDSMMYNTREFNTNPSNIDFYDKQILFNAKCDFEPHIRKFPFYVMRQEIFTMNIIAALKTYDSTGEIVELKNESRKNELLDQGYVLYQTVGMKSVVGCSGSAVFDEELNLYGMNVRGIGNKHELIYVPISVINEFYESIKSEFLHKF